VPSKIEGISLLEPEISFDVMNKKTPDAIRTKHKQQIIISKDTKIITIKFLLSKKNFPYS